jgi:hypothetical protein
MIELLADLGVKCGVAVLFGLGEAHEQRLALVEQVRHWRATYEGPAPISMNWAVQHPLLGQDGGTGYTYTDWAFPRAQTLDVCRLGDVWEELRGERALVVFPFNAFGNLPQPDAALRAVARCDCDALILTYRTDPASTALRRLYYARYGYSGLTESSNERGVLFRSREGLHSYAYHDAWLRCLLRGHSFDATTTCFGELGIGFWARRV